MSQMKIHELFAKPVERFIEGVIKADDRRFITTEVDEYVVTADIANALGEMAECYLNEPGANGVWISGFFGSGKSHLLKMLSMLLANVRLEDGRAVADIILPKLSEIDEETVRGILQRVIKIPSKSILFNIDQKSDAIGGDHGSPILEVFVKVLNELQGYYAKQGHIALFEFNLDSLGKLQAFKDAYQKATGRTWESDLPVIETLRNKTFAQVYSDFFETSYEEGLCLFDRMRQSYKVSIESFAERVKAFIDKQEPNFRLNFFVDEVGQYIGKDSKLMLNLQTIAETLSTVCKGQSWIFVTSQGDLRRVLGDLEGGEAQDFTKIEARFKTRLTLTGANVREVIQKRLLAKTEKEPEVLTSIYDAEKENLRTLYRFGEGSVEFKTWRGSDEFCAYYPFHPYQFDLFQRAIEQLSRHDAFTGKHTSVGERSMIAVFQEVAKKIRLEDVGVLGTFDLLFDGIANSLRGDIQTSVKQGQKNLENPIAIKILKALFLLKWVREFKATPRNIAILLIDHPNIDIQKHEQDVVDALKILETQSYLQRNIDCYEFLTDTEKDIEIEIKNTPIDDSQITRLLSDVVFADILKDPKIRYEGNSQDYTYARKLDDQLVGKDADLAVNIITTDHPNYGETQILAAQNTGKAELLAILPDDIRVINDARLFLKTQKYVQQTMSGGIDETKRVILNERTRQNGVRRNSLEKLCADLMGKAPLYLNGSRLNDINEGEARNRFTKGCQALISFAYPSLRMLKGAYDEALLTKTLLDADDLFAGGGHALNEAEQEIITYVMRNQNNGEKTSVEEIVRNFGRRPYGWYPMAVLVLIGRIFRMGKVELRNSDLLTARTALDGLKNSKQHGSIRVRMQEQFDPGKVTQLKNFHQDFFDHINEATDPRSVAQVTSEALSGEVRTLQALLDQAGRYSFLSNLQPAADKVKVIAEKDYSYLLNHYADYADDLLQAKDDYISPIKAFMHGAQRQSYDEVLAFLREEEANFGEIDASELQPLRELAESHAPFRGVVLPNAKAAITKVRGLIEAMLSSEREAAYVSLQERETRLCGIDDFLKLDEAQQKQVMAKLVDARSEITSARFVSAIRDRLSRYTSQDYPEQLAMAQRLASPRLPDPEPGDNAPKPPEPPKTRYIPVRNLKVSCNLPYIASEDDLAQWLDEMKKSILSELSKGNRISL